MKRLYIYAQSGDCLKRASSTRMGRAVREANELARELKTSCYVSTVLPDHTPILEREAVKV